MTMSQDQPQRARGVLPPPPDDGPTALDLPPLQPPPKSLQVAAARANRRGWPFGSWLLVAALFLAGTLVTYFLGR